MRQAANDVAVVAVFRGSKGNRDWLTNLSILPRDVPTDWNLQTQDGDLHRVSTPQSMVYSTPIGAIVVFKPKYSTARRVSVPEGMAWERSRRELSGNVLFGG